MRRIADEGASFMSETSFALAMSSFARFPVVSDPTEVPSRNVRDGVPVSVLSSFFEWPVVEMLSLSALAFVG